MSGSNLKYGREYVMIWASIAWYSAGSIVPRNGRITASDYVDILGNQAQSYGPDVS